MSMDDFKEWADFVAERMRKTVVDVPVPREVPLTSQDKYGLEREKVWAVLDRLDAENRQEKNEVDMLRRRVKGLRLAVILLGVIMLLGCGAVIMYVRGLL
jgi:hypothetical protein